MGRPKRIEFPGACYLVSLQGNNRQDLFLSNQDRRQFLALLRLYKARYGLKIYAYALLAARVELLLETGDVPLSVVMQGFNTQFTKYFNSAHNTVGHVFQGRYKALLVDPETHLAEMSRRVHLAPVRDGLAEKPWRYLWSSCQAYVEGQDKEPLVDSAAVLKTFGRSRLKQSVRYLGRLKESLSAARAAEPLPVLAGVAIGGPAFLGRLEQRREGGLSPARPLAAEARRIIAEVAARHGMDEEKVLGRLQWREVSAARREAVHRVWKETRMGVSELARLFSRTPSAISQALRVAETSAASSKS